MTVVFLFLMSIFYNRNLLSFKRSASPSKKNPKPVSFFTASLGFLLVFGLSVTLDRLRPVTAQAAGRGSKLLNVDVVIVFVVHGHLWQGNCQHTISVFGFNAIHINVRQLIAAAHCTVAAFGH